jgi:hypothetical protein
MGGSMRSMEGRKTGVFLPGDKGARFESPWGYFLFTLVFFYVDAIILTK